jgi:hypothetical protein
MLGVAHYDPRGATKKHLREPVAILWHSNPSGPTAETVIRAWPKYIEVSFFRRFIAVDPIAIARQRIDAIKITWLPSMISRRRPDC